MLTAGLVPNSDEGALKPHNVHAKIKKHGELLESVSVASAVLK